MVAKQAAEAEAWAAQRAEQERLAPVLEVRRAVAEARDVAE